MKKIAIFLLIILTSVGTLAFADEDPIEYRQCLMASRTVDGVTCWDFYPGEIMFRSTDENIKYYDARFFYSYAKTFRITPRKAILGTSIAEDGRSFYTAKYFYHDDIIFVLEHKNV